MDLLPKQDLSVNIDNKHKYGEVHTHTALTHNWFSLAKDPKSAVRKVGEIKYNFDSGQIFQQSKFLKEFGVQRTLGDWF